MWGRHSGHGRRGVPFPALHVVGIVIKRGSRGLGQAAGKSVLWFHLHVTRGGSLWSRRSRFGVLHRLLIVVTGPAIRCSTGSSYTSCCTTSGIFQTGSGSFPHVLLDRIVYGGLELFRTKCRHRDVQALVVRCGCGRARRIGRGPGTPLLRRSFVVRRTLPAVVGTRLLVLVARVTRINHMFEFIVADGR